jgi:hypothetical protein
LPEIASRTTLQLKQLFFIAALPFTYKPAAAFPFYDSL